MNLYETLITFVEDECKKTGCIENIKGKWRIRSNKTGKLWPAKYDTKEKAIDALQAYHVHNR